MTVPVTLTAMSDFPHADLPESAIALKLIAPQHDIRQKSNDRRMSSAGGMA